MNHRFEVIRDLPTSSAPVNSALDSVVATLGLNNIDLETSVGELLSTPEGQDAALALTGSSAEAFLDVLQKVCTQVRQRLMCL
jgi:hypothetical protein